MLDCLHLLTTERSEVVPFFRAVRAEERGVAKRPPPLGGRSPPSGSRSDPSIAGGLASVREFSPEKLSQTLTDVDETWQE